mmetsp:Transcript_43798/g.105901  ORF Transcript_43798/g.105901 Transcript_43798/m.105901 type:complete len:265 (+) Transcript_43798:53-847(+)
MGVEKRSSGGADSNVARANGHQSDGKGAAVNITKGRKSLHLLRKLFHALAGVALASVYEVLLDRQTTLKVFGVLLVLLALGEGLRFAFPESFFATLSLRVTSALARTYEIKHMSGMIFFLTGVLFCIYFYPKNVAILAILYLSVGDPCASACGIRWGHHSMKFSNGKSLVGFLGGMAACFGCTLAYFWQSHGPSAELIAVSLWGGVVGATTELLCGRVLYSDGETKGGPIDIDDNLAVPIFSGALFWGVLSFFPHVSHYHGTFD